MRFVVATFGLSLLAVACQVGLAQGPDRPDDQGVEGPPPPADFECDRGERQVIDTDGDKKPDTIVHLVDGKVICRGEDTNRNGKIDRWSKLDKERVIARADDNDNDGTLDSVSRDSDGDGTLDQTKSLH